MYDSLSNDYDIPITASISPSSNHDYDIPQRSGKKKRIVSCRPRQVFFVFKFKL